MQTNKLLIANRGEIACRVIKSARRLGWQTVAVYSSADKQSLHVKQADEAYLLGDPPVTDSYLNQQRILEIAKQSNCNAIHPGYGFLSENPDFAAACEAAELIFVGPPASAMTLMGMKGVAREHMQAAGVPVLPGINKVTDATTPAEIEAIGYPVLIKPEAGGGGKGMKIVISEKELEASIASARREASSAFGNDSLMIEKYLEHPRHIEIQIFADKHGNCVHLFERDCSLQRRHQKIIEESPAPLFSELNRAAMGEAAIKAARSINYVGAGTIEFLLGDDEKFYFMEMNTRLQVEHPVTEAVTHVDLVEWQLKVAIGDPLPMTQQALIQQGHSLEVRLYAEDPDNAFLPVAGRITHLRLPENDQIRIDNGVQPGDQVGVFYDPMLMKLISHAPDRPQAIQQLCEALSACEISGITTNRDFLIRLLRHPPFLQGGLGTDYLDNHLDDIVKEVDTRPLLCAAAIFLTRPVSSSPWHQATAFRLNRQSGISLKLAIGVVEHRLKLRTNQTNHFSIEIDDEVSASNCQAEWPGSSVFETPLDQRLAADNRILRLSINGGTQTFRFHQQDEKLTLFSDSRTIQFALPNEAANVAADEGNLIAPMSGKIIAILVFEGEKVSKGQQLAILEAMKMEHSITAAIDGTVQSVFFKEGDLVDEGTALFEFEAVEALDHNHETKEK